ncbi:hypothetical protein D9M68_890300 [compost metagenome]
MPGLEIGQRRTQPQAAKTEGGSEPDRPGRFGLALAQFGFQCVEPAQQLAGALTQCFAFGCGADAAGGALEQAQAEPDLERCQPFGHGRRRHPQRPSGHHQAAVLAHREHQFEIGTVQLFPLENESIAELLLKGGLSLRPC